MSQSNKKQFAVPNLREHKSKVRGGTNSAAASSRGPVRLAVPASAVKGQPKARLSSAGSYRSHNSSVFLDADVTAMSPQEDTEYDSDLEFEYAELLQTCLAECILDKKIEREKTEIDIQLTELAKRYEASVQLLDTTTNRLKAISFASEQQRLLDMKNDEYMKFNDITQSADLETVLEDLSVKEQSYLDCVDTKNVDLGYSKQSGHKQLSDALDDAIAGFESIRKTSKLDVNKLNQFAMAENHLACVEKDTLDLESMKRDFKLKLPQLNKHLLHDSSEKFARLIKDIDMSDGNDSDES